MNEKSERLARLALYLALNSNGQIFHRILRRFGSATEAFEGHDLRALGVNLTPLLSLNALDEAHAHLELCQKSQINVMIFGDPDYPLRLLEVLDPPPVLWIKGTLTPEDQYAVALVGSRKATKAGLNEARRFAYEGALSGLTIVSGLAKGIDAACHRGALEAQGRTLAVLGSGLNHIYPKENAALYEKIPHQGAIISEFPPDKGPIPALFPRRNRVIAGLSLAVVVVEAGERSGALITARLALELGRDVMALPGPVGSTSFKGTNGLIKSGAALVESMGEVISEIKPRLLEGLLASPHKNYLPQFDELIVDEPELTEASTLKSPKQNLREHAPPFSQNIDIPMGPGEELIMKTLVSGAMDVDSLIRQSGLSPAEMASLLLNLELLGLVSRLPSGAYTLQ
ncbi:MAG: DNA-processing protein DprA [Candidatus Adiutrix sp.]